MRTPALLVKQIKTEIQAFRRNPTAAIFTLVFPLIFLILGGLTTGKTTFEGHALRYVDLVTPGIVAYGVFSAAFTNLAMRITLLRDQGVLKRVRGTPAPTWLYLAGHIGTSVVISFVMTAILAIGGFVIYNVHFHLLVLPAMIATLALGAFAFCAIALALSGFIPNGDSAAPVVQLIGLPQFILGGIFFTIDKPGLIWKIARALPLPHMAHAMRIAYSSQTTGLGFVKNDLLVLATWAAVFTVIALRKFTWENKIGVTRGNRRQRQSPVYTGLAGLDSSEVAS